MTAEDGTQPRNLIAEDLGYEMLPSDNPDVEIYGRSDMPSTIERDRRSGAWTLFERDENWEPVGWPTHAGDDDLDIREALKELHDIDPQHQRGPSLGM